MEMIPFGYENLSAILLALITFDLKWPKNMIITFGQI